MNNCIITIKNKKVLSTQQIVANFIDACAKANYYFDKNASISFNNAKEITKQLADCVSYDNSVIFCPEQMISSVKGFISQTFGVQFNEKDCLHCDNKSVYVVADDVFDFNYVIDSLNNKYGVKHAKLYVKCIGAPLELIDEMVEKARAQYTNLSIFAQSVYDEQTIEITYDDSTPKMVLDGVLRTFMTALNPYVYAMEDVTLAQRVFELLKLRRMKISVAESFTGGGLSAKLVEIPGVSEVYFEGLNTYSNLSKSERLGVGDITLKQHGAVSGETACEMAQGLIDAGHCDVAISTTGIAGPSSDGTNKPVGLCFIAIAIKEGVSAYKYNFVGDRKTITNTAINHALFLAYKTLK